MPIFCWVFQTEGAKMKTFSRLLQAKPFRMGSNAQWKKYISSLLGYFKHMLFNFPQLRWIVNLKLMRYVFYSQMVLCSYMKVFP